MTHDEPIQANETVQTISPEEKIRLAKLYAAARRLINSVPVNGKHVAKTVAIDHYPGKFVFTWIEFSPDVAAAMVGAVREYAEGGSRLAIDNGFWVVTYGEKVLAVEQTDTEKLRDKTAAKAAKWRKAGVRSRG